MEQQELLENLASAIIAGDASKARESAQSALETHMDPLQAIEQGLSKGMTEVGARFESGDAFLPELLKAAQIFNAAMEILQPALDAQKSKRTAIGKMVIGSVKGDVHNIGKDIVSTVMGIHGYEIIDLGVDVPSLTFIEEAQKVKANAIGLSAIMTTTMPYQQEVIDVLKDRQLRDKFIVIVGGGSVTPEWVEQIGADAHGKSAIDAVEKLNTLLKKDLNS
jgi:corrinoid protein of di/trimethylamine methyltransferase